MITAHLTHQTPTLTPSGCAPTLAVSATFTAEPLHDALGFWMRELGQDAVIEFAPYNQVFQQLLDPESLLSRNQSGVNIILLRVEDWLRFDRDDGNGQELSARLERNAHDFIEALQVAAVRSATPYLLALCPASPIALADPSRRSLLQTIEDRITTALAITAGVTLIGPRDFAPYQVHDYHDPQRDALGHIPYTSLFFATLGTLLARRIHTLKAPPFKVVVLDCDNTLWKGVVGEEGAMGISISPAFRKLQEFLVELATRGFLICLCSKNEEQDVLDVFEAQPKMHLRRDHLVSWRINWEPKSENLRSLAQELSLGLDSFLFLDDNPVECAEVRANCPEVLTLQLPAEDEIEHFLNHIWAFDRNKVTLEDRQRTVMYKQNVERNRLQRQSQSFADFLAGLALNVRISEPAPDQLSRVAQLTQRTNQFNFTTIRRTEAEIRLLAEAGRECRIVEVSDRFGDYGLVGVMIHGLGHDALEIDTFLLSCRVLGRGVEHRMLNELGVMAQQLGLSSVEMTLIPTAKNLPARNFLDGIAAEFKHGLEGKIVYRLPAELAAAVSPILGVNPGEGVDAPEPAALSSSSSSKAWKVPPYERIASVQYRPDRVLALLEGESQERHPRPLSGVSLVPPTTEVETQLAKLWADLLRFDIVGIHDDYFELGGTSLKAVDLFTRIEDQFGVKLPLTSLIEAPTVAQLARLVEKTPGSRDSLVLIRAGGNKPPLFLVHDGDGETMLYRNLALRLDLDHAVYGLQPYSRENHPILHTRISEMAAYHIGKIQTVQPHGPYLVGGMCAGGVIAFEIARQLQEQGEPVAMVALIDAADVAASLKPWRFVGQRFRSFSSGLAQEQQQRPSFPRRAMEVATKAYRKTRNLTFYVVQSRAQILRDRLQMTLFRRCLDRGFRLPRFLHEIPVRRAYLFAEHDYQPGTPFEGELTLFRATCGEGNDEPYIERYSDPLLGWGRRATQGVRIYDVPGGHSSMLQEPNVKSLAAYLQDQIDEGLAGHLARGWLSTLASESADARAHAP
jgi:FkbH-like protein